MKNNYRQFSIYDLEVLARKKEASLPDMNIIAGIWKKMSNSGRTFEINSGESVMIIGDLEIDSTNSILSLLVRISSKSAPNSVYSDLKLGTFDEHIKVGDQGADFGCHVMISLIEEKSKPNIYTCAIEKITGLPAELIKRLLSKFLRSEYQENSDFFTYPHPGGGLDPQGRPRTDRCSPYIQLCARPSEALINDLNQGYLTGVTLIRTEPVQPIGGAAYLIKDRSELKLSIKHNNLPANIWDGITSAFKQNASKYQRGKISWKLKDTSKPVSIEVDTATSSIISDGYIKYFEIKKITPLLAQSSKIIVPHLIRLATPHFINNRDI